MSASAKQIQTTTGFEFDEFSLTGKTLQDTNALDFTAFGGQCGFIHDYLNNNGLQHTLGADQPVYAKHGGLRAVLHTWHPDGTRFYAYCVASETSGLTPSSPTSLQQLVEMRCTTPWDYKGLEYYDHFTFDAASGLAINVGGLFIAEEFTETTDISPAATFTLLQVGHPKQMVWAKSGRRLLIVFTNYILSLGFSANYNLSTITTGYLESGVDRTRHTGQLLARHLYYSGVKLAGVGFNADESKIHILTSEGIIEADANSDTLLPEKNETSISYAETGTSTGTSITNLRFNPLQPENAYFNNENSDLFGQVRIYDAQGKTFVYVMNATDATLHQYELAKEGFIGGGSSWNYTWSKGWFDRPTSGTNNYEFGVGSYNDLAFDLSHDGTLLTYGGSGDRLYTYSLSTPWDIRNRSYVRDSYMGSTTTSFGWDFKWGNNGYKMYWGDSTSDAYRQYTLTTPYDTSTASYDGLGLDKSFFTGFITFNNNGTKVWRRAFNSPMIIKYDLTTAWDLRTATNVYGYSLQGTTLFGSGSGNPKSLQTSAYSTSLGVISENMQSITSEARGPGGLCWFDNGNKIAISGVNVTGSFDDSMLYIFKCDLPYDLDTARRAFAFDSISNTGFSMKSKNYYFKYKYQLKNLDTNSSIYLNFEPDPNDSTLPYVLPTLNSRAWPFVYSPRLGADDNNTNSYTVESDTNLQGMQWLDNGNKLLICTKARVQTRYSTATSYQRPYDGFPTYDREIKANNQGLVSDALHNNHVAGTNSGPNDDSNGNREYIYTCSTPYDPSTINWNALPTHINRLVGGTAFWDAGYRGTYISPDGTKKFQLVNNQSQFQGSSDNCIMYYSPLSTAYDITSTSTKSDTPQGQSYSSEYITMVSLLSNVSTTVNADLIKGRFVTANTQDRSEWWFGCGIQASNGYPMKRQVFYYDDTGNDQGDDITGWPIRGVISNSYNPDYGSLLNTTVRQSYTYTSPMTLSLNFSQVPAMVHTQWTGYNFFYNNATSVGMSYYGDNKFVWGTEMDGTATNTPFSLWKYTGPSDNSELDNFTTAYYSEQELRYATSPARHEGYATAMNGAAFIEENGMYIFDGKQRLEGSADGTWTGLRYTDGTVGLDTTIRHDVTSATDFGVKAWVGTLFSKSGYRVYIAGCDRIYQFDLTSAYDLDSMILSSKVEFSSPELNNIHSLSFNSREDILMVHCGPVYGLGGMYTGLIY